MKIIAIIVVLLLGAGTALYAQNKKSKKDDKETAIFDVSMTCENCKKRIEKNIAYEKGVTDMKVDLPNKTVEIVFKKDKTSTEKLQAAIEKLGYEAKLLTENNKKEDKKE